LEPKPTLGSGVPPRTCSVNELALPPERKPTILIRAIQVAVVVCAAAAVGLTLFALDSPVSWGLSVLLIGTLALVLVRDSDLIQLGGLLAASVVVMGGEAGVSPGEAAYFALTLLFFMVWYGREVLAGLPSLRRADDVVAALWLVFGLGVAFVLSWFFGAHPADLRAEAISLFPFLFFFPVKEIVARHRWGVVLVVGVLVWYGLYTSLLNGLALRSVFTGATEWWQIADARFSTGETAMAASLLILMALTPALRSTRARLTLLAAFGIILGGLLLTKSRGYWLSTLFGVIVLLVVSPPDARRRIAIYLTVGIVVFGTIATVLFSDQLTLLVVGLVKRFSSLSTAATTDISLLNRYAENAEAWADIQRNPILGYGWGHQVVHYSVISQGTRHWSFLHNMYLFVWHKVGLWGLFLMLWMWGRGAILSALAARSHTLSSSSRAISAGAAAAIATLGLVANTSNPLGVIDATLISTVVLALAHGLAQRGETLSAAPPPPSTEGSA